MQTQAMYIYCPRFMKLVLNVSTKLKTLSIFIIRALID